MTFDQLSLWARELGFASVGIADTDLSSQSEAFHAWLEAGFHGSMDYMARGASARLDPQLLVANAYRAIMVTMNYAPDDEAWLSHAWETLANDEKAFVARYALGRDYHKVVRSRLQKLMTRVEEALGAINATSSSALQQVPLTYRVFCDSAPVMEVELATRAGLGWRGKHTLMLSREQGSMFFIGSVLTNFPFDITPTTSNHCGSCQQCIDVCPTQAIISPYKVDARRCISYLTIEHAGSIDPSLRKAMGNRIYGCDDCQLICPWNKFAQKPSVPDFLARHQLDDSGLEQLFSWTPEQFEQRMQGSAIRRIGHDRWLRNIAIALGNSRTLEAAKAVSVLVTRTDHPSEVVREHVMWAIEQQNARLS